MFSLVCKECGKNYENAWSGSKFCSKECYAKSRRTQEDGICKECGKHFRPTNPNQKYCSRECYDKVRIKDKECPICGKHFKPRKSSIYCSRKCYQVAIGTHKDIECGYCGKAFHQTTSIQKYCSKRCFDNARIYLEDVRCKECGKLFHPRAKGTAYCSIECKNKSSERLDKIKETNIKKYGVPYYCMASNCRDATTIVSKPNLQFEEHLKELGFKTQLEFPIENRSYDIKVGNTLIEINPFPYHNSTWNPFGDPKEPDYHYNKLKLAKDNGYRCIMVWDWDDYEKIPYLLGEKTNLYARKCEIRQITREDCHDFFESYHLQGDTKKNKNNIYIGLYYNNELVECMSFGKPRNTNKYEREILRLCSHKDYKIVGGANKIFKKFLEIANPNNVMSSCDMSKFDGGVYKQLGFKLLKWNKPSKHYYNPKEKPNRQHITYQLLKHIGVDNMFGENFGKGTDNDELMRQRGYVEIYDCGQSTFVWTKE